MILLLFAMLNALGVIYAGCDHECLSVTLCTHTPGAPVWSPDIGHMARNIPPRLPGCWPRERRSLPSSTLYLVLLPLLGARTTEPAATHHMGSETETVKTSMLGEFRLWLRGTWTQLVSKRMWVQSLALLSGLRIWHCLELWCRLQLQFQFNSTSSLGTSICHRCDPKKQKRKKNYPCGEWGGARRMILLVWAQCQTPHCSRRNKRIK